MVCHICRGPGLNDVNMKPESTSDLYERKAIEQVTKHTGEKENTNRKGQFPEHGVLFRDLKPIIELLKK